MQSWSQQEPRFRTVGLLESSCSLEPKYTPPNSHERQGGIPPYRTLYMSFDADLEEGKQFQVRYVHLRESKCWETHESGAGRTSTRDSSESSSCRMAPADTFPNFTGLESAYTVLTRTLLKTRSQKPQTP